MTRLQRLQLRQSEARSALGDLLDTAEDKRSDSYADDLGKATAEVRALESELQAALVADEPAEQVTTADTPEDRELSHLVASANVGAILDSALDRRAIDGATADLQQHYNLAANQVPLDLLSGPVETRAITTAPTNVGQEQQAIVPAVFPTSAAEFLGISTPRVPVGRGGLPGFEFDPGGGDTRRGSGLRRDDWFLQCGCTFTFAYPGIVLLQP